jgi:hypothetical protein
MPFDEFSGPYSILDEDLIYKTGSLMFHDVMYDLYPNELSLSSFYHIFTTIYCFSFTLLLHTSFVKLAFVWDVTYCDDKHPSH